MQIQMTDSRRLTGPNLLLNGAGAIIDVACPNDHRQVVANLWKDELLNLLKLIGWEKETIKYRFFENGLNLAFSAELDSLYSATELNELAFHIACRKLEGEKDITANGQFETIRQHLSDEQNPHLQELIKLAKSKQISFLSDDETFSLGLGKYSQKWQVSQLPHPDEVNWSKFRDIPVVFITGSNGKSTTVRLLASILNSAGLKTGMTSTDFIRIGDQIIDHGDYSGPGGARTILRHPIAEAAVLEIARGGILRRGLPCDCAIAAAVTNIAEDHLGDYGITQIDEMAQTKLLVRKGLKKNGILVINADDPVLMAELQKIDDKPEICYFSLNKTNFKHQVCLDKKSIYYTINGETELICNVDNIPITLNGAARHNVANAMTAIALAKANHIKNEAILRGLKRFKGDLNDNPGRGNYFKIKGMTILVDFAHNAHGMRSIVETVQAIPSSRKILMIGQAGDRSDADIQNLARQAAEMKPDIIIIIEIAKYLRGRKSGEVPAIFRHEFEQIGYSGDQLIECDGSLNGTKKAIELGKSGDLLILFALSDREQVFRYLRDITQ
ncbi:MAG: Mur ligase [Calditrichaeota bacterium]|nr:Mur ligase [Calditrichota bacterium]